MIIQANFIRKLIEDGWDEQNRLSSWIETTREDIPFVLEVVCPEGYLVEGYKIKEEVPRGVEITYVKTAMAEDAFTLADCRRALSEALQYGIIPLITPAIKKGNSWSNYFLKVLHMENPSAEAMEYSYLCPVCRDTNGHYALSYPHAIMLLMLDMLGSEVIDLDDLEESVYMKKFYDYIRPRMAGGIYG